MELIANYSSKYKVHILQLHYIRMTYKISHHRSKRILKITKTTTTGHWAQDVVDQW
jgi:hypothetical protein